MKNLRNLDLTKNEEINSIFNLPFDMDDDWNKKVEDYFFAAYEYSKFVDAMNFLKSNNIYLYDEAFFDIKELFIEDLFKKKASLAVRNEVAASIDRYFDYNKCDFKANTRKVMIQKIDDLFYFCIDIVRDASMNGKKSTSKKSVDDYYESFLDSIDKTKELGHNIYEGDVLYKMFQTIAKCKVEGGEFDMIDALYDKLGEYLEANY